jgi:hypothetical protein
MSEPALETKALETKALETPYDEKGVNAWLIKLAAGAIRKKLGASYDPVKLIYLMKAVCDDAPLSDSDVLDLAEMFIFYMRNSLNWTLGVQVFEHYLNDGGQAAPNLTISSSHLLDSPDFRLECCLTQSKKLEDAVAARVADTTGIPYPRDKTTGEPTIAVVEDEFGQPITINPAPSPLRTGGTEVIYAITSVRITPIGESEIAATFNRVGVTSKVTVNSTKTSDTSWDIEISEWKSWGWDLADFNPADKPSIQRFPIDVGSFFKMPGVEKKVTEILSQQVQISYQCLEQLIGFDSYMLQLANRSFSRTNIVTGASAHYFPKPFYARFQPSWDFLTETNPCGVPQKYMITEPAG